MYVKYKLAYLSLIVIVLLAWLNISYAIDPQPRPGIPTQPVPELPKVKPPEIPDLTISISGAGFGHMYDLYPDNPGMGPSDFWVIGEVLNSGRVAVRGCEVDVFLSADRKVSPDDRVMGTILISEAIPPPARGRLAGSAVVPRTAYSIIGVPAGTYYICARVDPRNRIIESDEKNNDSCVERPIRIHPAVAR